MLPWLQRNNTVVFTYRGDTGVTAGVCICVHNNAHVHCVFAQWVGENEVQRAICLPYVYSRCAAPLLRQLVLSLLLTLVTSSHLQYQPVKSWLPQQPFPWFHLTWSHLSVLTLLSHTCTHLSFCRRQGCTHTLSMTYTWYMAGLLELSVCLECLEHAQQSVVWFADHTGETNRMSLNFRLGCFFVWFVLSLCGASPTRLWLEELLVCIILHTA